ncbi:MAG: DUF3048 domain-containing protein [Brockia lithotrophica]|nr:DUF3048 domain-containing protein [Brockia lithotrophica]
MRRLWVHGRWAVALVVLVFLAGCFSRPEQEPSAPSPPPSSPAPAAPQPTTAYAPLTGREIGKPIARRPLAVVIENAPDARPQSGLFAADFIYEFLAEGGIPRFLAVFHSGMPDEIGPVRSARPYFIEVARAFGAVLVHAGGSDEADAILAGGDPPHLDGLAAEGKYFWRSPDRKPPHNLYTSAEKLEAYMAARGIPPTGQLPSFSFSPEGPAALSSDVRPAGRVRITYRGSSPVTYTYEEGRGGYVRATGGTPDTDRRTQAPVQLANVVIVRVPHTVADSAGHLKIDLADVREAWWLAKGEALPVEARWEGSGPYRLFRDSREIPLVPGATWVVVLPLQGYDVSFAP